MNTDFIYLNAYKVDNILLQAPLQIIKALKDVTFCLCNPFKQDIDQQIAQNPLYNHNVLFLHCNFIWFWAQL